MFAAAPGDAAAVEDRHVVADGGGAFCFSFLPSAAAFAAFDDCDVGVLELGAPPPGCRRRRRVAAEAALHVLDLVLEDMPGRQRLGEERVRDHLVAAERVPALADLDVAA